MKSPEKLLTSHKVVFFIIAVLTLSLTSTIGLQYQVSNLTIPSVKSDINNLQHQVIQENVSLSQLYDNVEDSVVLIQGLMKQTILFFQQIVQVQGSGFVYNCSGHMVVITNNHVVNGVNNITVTFSNGDAFPVAVLGSDISSDLAVLSVIRAPISEYKPLQVVSSSSIRVGDFVIAVGNPFGLTGSMTTGIVSALGRTIIESTSSYLIADIIQTNALINPGNSGGPLLNDKGQVVGITTATVKGSQGIGFAIPSNTILREIASLVNTGSYNQHPWLGITGIDMTYAIANKMNLNITYGELIENVTYGGPAYNAGLKGSTNIFSLAGSNIGIGGDVIIAFNGARIVNLDDLGTYLEENTLPNQTIIVTIVRTNSNVNTKMNVPVVLGARP